MLASSPRPAHLLALLALVTVASAGPEARGDGGPDRGELARHRAAITASKGSPDGYVAARMLWREWETSDPTAVEELLRDAAADAKVTPPLRAYVGLLSAYARRRRGDLAGARAMIRRLGFVDRWLVVGPFDNEGKSGFAQPFGPEADIGEVVSLAKSYPGKERPVHWRPSPDVFPNAWVDLGALVRPSEKACAYATTFVHDDRGDVAARPVSLWVGNGGAIKVFWNGAEVLADDKLRSLDADRYGVRVTLRPGENRVTVKVCGDESGPLFSLRLADAQGAPDPHLAATADPGRASAAAAQRFRKGDAPALLSADKNPDVIGPFVAASRAAQGGSAKALESHARYLVLTESDDPVDRQAPKSARRAAELGATVPRLLLAGELAEGRNQRGTWIDRAEDLVRRGAVTKRERIDVLLARASHARGGPYFRDAIPYVDRVLALDPDEPSALAERADLYSEAGLKETAYRFLERALARNPRSVALLRATAATLRDLDRTTDESELLDRYAALRADDQSILKERIELAVARRDRAAALYWADRAARVAPDSAQALANAARVHAAFGDRAESLALLRQAVDIAPDDVDALRRLADGYALAGKKEEQLRLLRRVLVLRPQAKEVREYVAHAEPEKPRPDEAFARPAKEFLARRGEPAAGKAKRTLVDLSVSTVFPNGLSSKFRQVVFQPLTTAAASQARVYAFGYQADSEAVQLRGARVYRASGAVDEAVESGEGPADNPSIAMYTSGRTFYVHFPRLDPGDVVELLYRVEDVAPHNAFADYFGEVVYLQADEPVLHAEYVLLTPKSRAFYFNDPKVPGLVRTAEERGDQRVTRFVAKDVPPLEGEQGQPPYSELLGHVHVSTYKSWDDMGRWYWGLVKDQLVADDEVRRRVAEITKGLTTEAEKVRAVYNYVVQKTRYVALEFGIHGFKPYRCAQIFARGFGDCKDKATLIVTMLRELGIPATLVIVRTGMRGDFESSPASLAPFDHAIAYVPSMDLYLDGTAEFTGSTELPAMDRGSLALQVNEGKPKLVRMPDPPASESVRQKTIELSLGADRSADVVWSGRVTGAFASAFRQRYHAEATRAQRVQEDLGGELARLEVDKVTASDLEDLERPVEVKATGRIREMTRKDGDAESVPVGPGRYLVREYAALSKRSLPLRLGARATSEVTYVVRLPKGATVRHAPRPASGKSPFGSFEVTVDDKGGELRVRTRITLDVSRVAPSEYPAFRTFCEAVDRALDQRLVFAHAK